MPNCRRCERIFATRPITLHSLKLRAVLAKYWHQYGDDAEKWQAPSDCDAWEDQVMAHLIDGVLQTDAPPAEPSPDLALFLSALQGVEDYSRAHPEPPDVKSAEYEAWYAERGQRLEGLNRIAERILGGNAPPLDVLAAIASEYVLLGGHPRAEQIADGEAHDGIPDWVVKRLVHTLLPIPRKVG